MRTVRLITVGGLVSAAIVGGYVLWPERTRRWTPTPVVGDDRPDTRQLDQEKQELRRLLGSYETIEPFVQNHSATRYSAWLAAANAGDVEGILLTAEGGRLGVPGSNPNDTIMWYKLAAERGEPSAMLSIGNFYFDGTGGVRAHWPTAMDWYRQAAEFNYAPALYRLGVCHTRGDSLEKNSDRAFDYYLRAAELKYLPAIERVADCYAEGRGVARNTEKAIYWYERAAAAGSEKAKQQLRRFGL